MVPRLIFVALFLVLASHVAVAADRPNILLILADDLAWSDLGCYGAQLCETPHLDRLAAEGARFTDAYAAAPLCSPARAALITGKTPARLGFEFVTKWKHDKPTTWPGKKLEPPKWTLDLPLEERTIAEVLSDAGYRTGIAGKWHLNTHYETYNGWSPEFGPFSQGFQWGAETFGSHPWAFRGKEAPDFSALPTGQYAPDGLTDNAIEFLQEQRAGEPFFLFVSHFYVHSPVRDRGRWLSEKYKRKLAEGESPKRAEYCAFVETLDHHVGRLLAALDESGLSEDTFVAFTSDNGGHPEFAYNAPLRGSKWNLYEGGIRVPLITRWPSHIEPGSVRAEPTSGVDFFATAAELAGVEAAAPDSHQSWASPRDLHGRELVWHFPYYHPERKYLQLPQEIGVADGVISQTRPSSAIRRGRYKLHLFHEDDRVELYDLSADLSERHDLTGNHPKLAAELTQRLRGYLKEADARWPTRND